jgi:CO dehydrogenase maturation factor
MKLAISGKGGTGKSTLAAGLSLLMAKDGWRVIAVDADPDGNLAAALGASPEEAGRIVPISRQKELIEERTGAKVKQYGQMFKLNPEVSDITEGYGTNLNGVTLLVLGAIEAGGSGCACPESVLIRALVSDLVLHRKEALVMDMEAGIEHLGRATARGVNTLLVMVEPSQRAIDSAHRVARLGAEIGLRDICFVANKVTGTADEQYIRTALSGRDIVGVIPWSEEIRAAERHGRSVLDGASDEVRGCLEGILRRLSKTGEASPFVPSAERGHSCPPQGASPGDRVRTGMSALRPNSTL